MPSLMRFTPPDPDTLSPLRSMHSLRETHVGVLAKALPLLPGTWSLERHEGCDGDLTLILMPQHQERENLVVNREADGFHLVANQDDDYRELGCFATMKELVASLLSNLASTMQRNKSA